MARALKIRRFLFTKVQNKRMNFHKSANGIKIMKIEGSLNDGLFFIAKKIKPDPFLKMVVCIQKPIRATY